jgi:biopolymer transport protein TolQ
MHDSAFLQILSQAGVATWVTVAAMFILSIGVWAILIQKWFGNRRKRRSYATWGTALGSKPSLQDMVRLMKGGPDSPMAHVTQSALREIEGLSQYVSYDSIEARGELVREAADRAVDAEKDLNERGMTYLAFCAATGPLIGLLGTVWGIMDTFFEIGKQGSANITVVAPGIAEALMAVLSGLLVAIQASLGFDASANFNRQAESLMYSFGSEVVSAFKRGDLLALDRAASRN